MWCPHDDDPNSCPPCRNDAEGEAMGPLGTKDRTRVMTTAVFASRCPVCGEYIEPGTTIAKLEDDSWGHAWDCG